MTAATGLRDAPAGATGVQYVWNSWSDSGAISHSISVPSTAATYTASFSTQYQLTTQASPSADGSVTAPTSGGYYASGAVIPVVASANLGYQFNNWTTSNGGGIYFGNLGRHQLHHAQRPGDGDREFRGEQRRRHPRHLAAGIVGEREWRHAASGASHCALACWEPADDCHQHAAGLERDAVHLPELVGSWSAFAHDHISALTVSPYPSYSFGTVYLGTLTTENFTVSNTGTTPITMNGPFVSILQGGDSKEFVEVDECPKSLPGRSHCTISVTFVAGPLLTANRDLEHSGQCASQSAEGHADRNGNRLRVQSHVCS